MAWAPPTATSPPALPAAPRCSPRPVARRRAAGAAGPADAGATSRPPSPARRTRRAGSPAEHAGGAARRALWLALPGLPAAAAAIGFLTAGHGAPLAAAAAMTARHGRFVARTPSAGAAHALLDGLALVVAGRRASSGSSIHAARPARRRPHADGIVAFTGGAGRVETALRLLQAHRAQLLLLSGIGGGADLPELAHRAGVDPAPLAGAGDARPAGDLDPGNAPGNRRLGARPRHPHADRRHRYYHMPRALTELRGRCRGNAVSGPGATAAVGLPRATGDAAAHCRGIHQIFAGVGSASRPCSGA